MPSIHIMNECGLIQSIAILRKATQDEAATATGAGDEALTLGTLCISVSPPTLLALALFSSWPFSLFSLLLPSAELAPDSSSPSSSEGLGGAVHLGISHTTPVKLLSVKPPLAHLRQGLPDLSRARRPALIAPWLALGPNLCAAAWRTAAWSMVPSSLHNVSMYTWLSRRGAAWHKLTV